MTRSRKIPSPFTALPVVVKSLLHSHGLKPRHCEYSLQTQWGKIVGELISQHARPDAIRFGRLHVLVDSPAWLQQLTFLKPDLLRKIEAHIGQPSVVKDVVLQLGKPTP